MFNTHLKQTFLKDGKSEYIIIVPDNADFYEDYASRECKRLFFEATGVTLPIVTESEEKAVAFDENKAYISIGRTKIFETSGVDNDFSILKRDGYRIVTKGNVLILIGGGSYGTVYAIYGFMERQFGYRYYHPDEVYIKKTSDDSLKDYDVTDIPDFENRTGGNYYSGSDAAVRYEGIADCAIRMRTFEFYGKGRDGKPFWGSWVHNHGEYLDGRKYKIAHRDWYSPEFTQLCLSNEEMWPEFAQNVIKRIKRCKEQEYFGLGQEDSASFCGCDRCKEQIKKYGRSGIMMRFTNYVARTVEQWRKENAPERNIYIGTLAYHFTGKPPVKKDENGNYVPLDDSVVAEKNVFVLMAPIWADYSAPFDDEENNADTKEMIEGWPVISDKLMMWIYGANYSGRFRFFDNLHVLSENYKLFKKYDYIWFYYETNFSKQGTAFQSMLHFIHAQLAWNTNLDLKDLVVEFMNNFYKDAAPQMKEYLKRLDSYHKERKAILGKKLNRRIPTLLWEMEETQDVLSKEFYDYKSLVSMLNLLEEGIAQIKKAKYHAEKEKMLIDRIRLEKLTIQYLISFFCEENMTREQFIDFVDAFIYDWKDLGISAGNAEIDFRIEHVENLKKGIHYLDIPDF